ncbi:DUF2508 family protein [Thermoanaerobacteraceae bacterium SP2]|nr:DUF2508 family protein [Thermoanaerobacteraceae bacterium SP2]
MTENLDRNRKKWEDNFIEEIENARVEIELAERAFQWVKNDPEAVDAALSRIEASIEHYNFLIKQAKQLGISLDKKVLYSKLLKI